MSVSLCLPVRRACQCLTFAALAVGVSVSGAAGGGYAIVHEFDGAGGQGPTAGLVQGPDGAFYGTAVFGGTWNGGVAYRLTAAGDYQVLHEFGSGPTVPTEPLAGLVLGQDGYLYGTTVGGGEYEFGAIYRLGTDGSFAVLHSFNNDGVQGIGHVAPLMQASDGNFYGTTASGGAYGQGTVYRMSPSGAFKTLHAFGAPGDGIQPRAGLVQASDGNLYGTTGSGGMAEFPSGTVFRLSLKGKVSLIHSFSGTGLADGNPDGCGPVAELVQGQDGNLWSAAGCGAYGQGVVYSLSLKGRYKGVHSFQVDEGVGGSEFAALVQLPDGRFIGTSDGGGANGGGVAYSVTPKGKLAVLHAFPSSATDGDAPFGPVLCVAGVCRGTTYDGGNANLGTVYSLQP